MATDYTRLIQEGFQTGTFAQFDYGIANIAGNTITLPVYANSTTTRNIPLKYVGNTIADLWPWANGSVTANAIPPGYNFTSTGPYEPLPALALFIPTTTSSFDGYFKVIESNSNATTWDDSYYAEITLTLTCFSNVGNTEIQLVPFLHTTGSNNNVLTTNYLTVSDVKQFPKQSIISITNYVELGNTTDKVGYYIRNITANSEVTVNIGTIDIVQIVN
jgi:hypothetical protein